MQKSCEDQFQMELSKDFANNWAGRVWPKWERLCSVSWRLPGSHMQRSAKSQRAKNLEDAKAAQFFCVSTPMALCLLARWSHTLQHEGPKDKAKGVLEHLCKQAVEPLRSVCRVDLEPQSQNTPMMEHTPKAVGLLFQKGRVCVQPLLAAFPRLKKRAEYDCPGSSNYSAVSLSVADLLIELSVEGSVRSLALLGQLACWLAMVVEHSPWVKEASSDPLDIPVVQGPKRARVVEAQFKQAVAKMAARPGPGRSSREVVATIDRFRKAKEFLKFRSTNKWQCAVARGYLANARETFSQDSLRFWSLASDGTRLSGRETQLTALFSADIGVSWWCPPQAGPFPPPPRKFNA